MGFEERTLGRTGLRVSPIGIGCGFGITGPDVRYAFDRGINYFFFSSDLHHFAYRPSVDGIRSLCGSQSSVREKVVLATVSYVGDPEKLPGVLCDQFHELGVDYIDVFHWGWITEASDGAALFGAVSRVMDGGEDVDAMRKLLHLKATAEEVGVDLKKRGLVRHVGASFHSRAQAAKCLDGPCEVMMLRYNVSHRGAEQDVFPLLTGDQTCDPGIVVFNSAHEGEKYFHQRIEGYPQEYPVPSVPDCYRFALTNPAVDLVLTGVKNRAEVDAALSAVEAGPLTERQMDFMGKYGLIHANKAKIRTPKP